MLSTRYSSIGFNEILFTFSNHQEFFASVVKTIQKKFYSLSNSIQMVCIIVFLAFDLDIYPSHVDKEKAIAL